MKLDNIPSVCLLINGFSSFKSMSIICTKTNKIIPADVIHLIGAYCFDILSHLVLIKQDKPISIYSMMTRQITSIKICHINHNNTYKRYNTIKNGGHTQINKNKLPINIIKQMNTSSCLLSKSNKWSFHVSIGGELYENNVNDCYLTSFHPSLPYKAYTFKLPSFPYNITNASVIYNKQTHNLYAMNCKFGTILDRNNRIILKNADKIYSLNFNNVCTDRNPWKWTQMNGKLHVKRWNTSICSVKNDKYIAIIGGYKYDKYIKTFEMYSITQQTSMLLKDMKFKRNKPISYYHKNYNSLIVSSDNTIESFDFHKGNWSVLCDGIFSEYGTVKKIWNTYNQNVLFVSQLNEYNEINIAQFDLRSKQYSIVNHNANIPNIMDYFHIFV
eukprot:532687_1